MILFAPSGLSGQALTELGNPPTDGEVLDAIKGTLAWQQLDELGRASFLGAASQAYGAFKRHAPKERRRWAHSGMSLPSAASLDAVALQVLEIITEDVVLSEAPQAIAMLLGDGRLARILQLSENQRRGFKKSRNSPRDQPLPVDLMALLIDWVSGVELQVLADKHLGVVINEDYRYEQLAEFIASVFEHHLPWALGTVVAWVNEVLEEQDGSFSIPDDLAAAVHYGVATREALSLMLGGVRSRRLANRVAQRMAEARLDSVDTSLRDWLVSQSISTWRRSFDASPTEIADLLAFARDPSVQLVNRVLEGEEYTLPYLERVPVPSESSARIAYEPGELAPAPLAIFVNSEIVGTIGPDHHDDVSLLTGIGIPLDIRVHPSVSGGLLMLRLMPEDTPPA